MKQKKRWEIVFFTLMIVIALLMSSCASQEKPDEIRSIEKQMGDLEKALEVNPNNQYLREQLGKKMFEYGLKKAELEGVERSNLPFLLESEENKKGILLMHGLTATPWEVRELAEYLNKNGITVYAPIMPGHGTNLTDLEDIVWEDWYSESEFNFKALEYIVDDAFVGGISLGSAMSLMLGIEHDTQGVITISSPIFLQDKRSRFVWLLKHFIKYTDHELTGEEERHYYRSIPSQSVSEMLEMVEQIKLGLRNLREPILIMHSKADQRVDIASSRFIEDAVNSNVKDIIIYDNATHVIIKDELIKQDAFENIYRFITEN